MKIFKWSEIRGGAEDAFQVHRRVFRDEESFPCHGHDFAELFLIEEGTGVHEVNGTEVLLRSGDLVFMRRHDRHGFRALAGAPFRQANLIVPWPRMAGFRRRYFGEDNLFFWEAGALPATVRLRAAERDQLSAAASQLIHGPRGLRQLDRFLLNLFDLLAPPGGLSPANDLPGWLAMACDGILRERDFSSGCAGLAKRAGRSPEHVARTMRKHLGVTPWRFLHERRLDYAARELEAGTGEVLDIAAECGFASLSQFYKAFRERFGMPPVQYRSRHRSVLEGG